MHITQRSYLAPIGLGLLLVIGMIVLLPATQANAQCGSQSSSCKNCHETQAQDPVNNDGTGWHVSHAFGDFCYLCHAGNNQSMDKEQAHAGMVAPMSDVQAACASCHPDDLNDRANVYAAVLGVEAGMGGGTTGAPSSENEPSGTSEGSTAPEQASPVSAPIEMVVQSAEVIDYSQLYDETVLGKRTISWGNVILWAIILVIAFGGGFFVYSNERKLRGLPLLPGAKPKRKFAVDTAPVVEGYSSEITALLPLIAELNPQGIYALKKLLANPEQANDLLYNLSRLDPDLIRRLRALDRESRALLAAVSGD